MRHLKFKPDNAQKFYEIKTNWKETSQRHVGDLFRLLHQPESTLLEQLVNVLVHKVRFITIKVLCSMTELSDLQMVSACQNSHNYILLHKLPAVSVLYDNMM